MSDLSGDLERAIDAVVDSYEGPMEINNLETAELPNKRAIIEAYNHLKPAIFMGFYSLRSLSPESLRYSVSEHLYPAYEILCEQTHRAFTYEARRGRSVGDARTRSHEALITFLNGMPELRRKLNEDALAAHDGDPAARSLEEIIFSYPSIEAITAYRIAHELLRLGIPMIPRIISEVAHSQTGIDIHPGAEIGNRFFLDHGTGVVIGETTQIGQNVKIYQGVTLGALSLRRSQGEVLQGKRHPTIGDNVTIYAGATILGGETVIGDDSVIGGNVWLVKSVPSGSKVFGRSKD